jgi:hypothetical protein
MDRSFKTYLESVDYTILDNDGSPLKVYHGRSSSLPPGKFPDNPNKGLHYFTPSQIYAEKSYGTISAFYLSIRNPKFIQGRDASAADLYKDILKSSEKPHDGTISYWPLSAFPGGVEEAKKGGWHVDQEGKVWFELSVSSKDQIKPA